MVRFLSTTAAAAASLMLVAAVPAAAQSAYYSATAANAVKKTSIVTRNTIWKCKDTVCTAAKAPDRDATLCVMVAQRVGQLSAFTVNGTAFDAEALDKCNAAAS
ncbi:hypothetical protein LZK98_19560 [Sphingomonas cannabina]|uniref:CC_3452 family protein n=1 Tax=Sphingomonas cannabina TaxID=2899123 RepID=UPI001F24B849|nr:hypothetical protein [Sphingomonas cannabina]UIJ45211.1 hypothetical protein LZK98_19560 [Sphingomonas cannabina]